VDRERAIILYEKEDNSYAGLCIAYTAMIAVYAFH